MSDLDPMTQQNAAWLRESQGILQTIARYGIVITPYRESGTFARYWWIGVDLQEYRVRIAKTQPQLNGLRDYHRVEGRNPELVS
jgi:hypothetical protein